MSNTLMVATRTSEAADSFSGDLVALVWLPHQKRSAYVAVSAQLIGHCGALGIALYILWMLARLSVSSLRLEDFQ